jgi:hypothetical protein
MVSNLCWLRLHWGGCCTLQGLVEEAAPYFERVGGDEPSCDDIPNTWKSPAAPWVCVRALCVGQSMEISCLCTCRAPAPDSPGWMVPPVSLRILEPEWQTGPWRAG